MDSFIKRNRKRKGWTQAELAAQLRLSQQFISAWERGISRPGKSEVSKLALVLGLDEELLERSFDNTASTSLTRPLIHMLPIADLSWPRFQDFILELVRLLYPDLDIERYGLEGEKQDGIDLVAMRGKKIIKAFQCKRYKQFGPQKVKDAIAAVPSSMQAEEYIIALSRQATLPAKARNPQPCRTKMGALGF